ncbi:MAG: hypothetical protein HW380_3077 [Magnetococcales bacterium]|nr:hypothetical protein [Magnetococcales bacterium]HIJ85697.1 HEPN domain-containing protein [Magnetococcales bacterium]
MGDNQNGGTAMPIICRPANKEAWLEVAMARSRDANTLKDSPSCTTAAVYMAGYSVEASLKAYCVHQDIRKTWSGASGHDLKSIWKESKLKLSDVSDTGGTSTFYLQEWSTDLRYCSKYNFPNSTADLIKGSNRLISFINQCIKRTRRRK